MSSRRTSSRGSAEPSSPSTPAGSGRRGSGRGAAGEPPCGGRPARRGSFREGESPGRHGKEGKSDAGGGGGGGGGGSGDGGDGAGSAHRSAHGSSRPGSGESGALPPYGSPAPRESDEDRRARIEEECRQAEADAAAATQLAIEVAAYEKGMDAKVQHAKDLGVLVAPVSKARVTLRIFTHRQSVFRSHSFLVGSEQGGLSEKLGRVPILANKTTLEDLRVLIETVCDNNMMRRNPIYQEFLITVQSMPNPYNYSEKDMRQYRFAYFAAPDDKLPTMIPLEEEGTRLVSKSVVNFITDDLLMVARTQLRPDFSLPDPEDAAIGR